MFESAIANAPTAAIRAIALPTLSTAGQNRVRTEK
jgi:hypothetical protein